MVSISFRNVLIAFAVITFYVAFMFSIDKFKNLTSNKNWANKRAKNYKLFGHFDHNFETKRSRKLFLANLPSFALLFRQKQHHLMKTAKWNPVEQISEDLDWLLLWLSTIWCSMHVPEAEFLSAAELFYTSYPLLSFLSLWDDTKWPSKESRHHWAPTWFKVRGAVGTETTSF